MKWFHPAILILASSAPLFSQQDDNIQMTYEKVDGQNVLTHAVTVEGELKDVWALFTTTEGCLSWMAPFAHIDFREGGLGETSYDPNAKPGDEGNIVSRYTKIKAMKFYESKLTKAPKDNPYGDVLMDLHSRVSFEPLPGKVKISISMIGWQDNESHNQVRKFFESGNNWYCQRLIKRCKEGPLPWEGVQ